ncbi:sensor histidine kinase [Synechocystis sp. PCC 7509]|uniref:sensor histidine kinase n=1 Tax=Synechocystis sp. PCC 7509 TaxID=927677 RepID=UPI0002AC2BFD|nr:ATP-binding protein [Synechocystis sp. PCC 7509]
MQTKPFQQWRRVAGEARTRILIWYAVLMALSMLVAIPTIRWLLFTRIDARVRADLASEVQIFQTEVTANFGNQAEALPQINGEQKVIARPSAKKNLAEVMEDYLSRQLPEDDTYLIAIINKQFYKSSPRGLPKPLQSNSKLMQRWLKLSRSEQGEVETTDRSIGKVLYIVEPVKVDGEVLGVFAAAHTTAGERAEGLEAVKVVIQVMVVVLTAALMLTWLAAGRVLAPLRLLTVTAHSISESDLTQRLPVDGKGEIAELAITFNEMMDRLQAAFASQRNFINDASHELRTPITIIRGHLELMGDETEEQQETLALVFDEIDRMSRFVNDLTLLAKAERPDFLCLETVDVDLLTEELFAKAKALADRDWCLDAKGKGQLIGDRQRITEAIMNLAQNATQFTTVGDRIAIGSAVANGKARFWVRDTGIGIAPADKERIFERFARAANSYRRSEGAGLGLSIVSAIAIAHSGSVKLYSKQGVGATFTLIIPLQS